MAIKRKRGDRRADLEAEYARLVAQLAEQDAELRRLAYTAGPELSEAGARAARTWVGVGERPRAKIDFDPPHFGGH